MILKIAPLCLAEPHYSTVEFGLEYILDEKYAIQGQIGYGNKHLNFRKRLVRYLIVEPKLNTFRIRIEGRKYFTKRNYMALDIMYRRSDITNHIWVGKGCVDTNNCSYFKLEDGKINKNILATHYKLGKQVYLSKRFVIDMYVGLGIRSLYVKSYDSNQRANSFFFSLDRRVNGSFVSPSITASIKIGYTL